MEFVGEIFTKYQEEWFFMVIHGALTLWALVVIVQYRQEKKALKLLAARVLAEVGEQKQRAAQAAAADHSRYQPPGRDDSPNNQANLDAPMLSAEAVVEATDEVAEEGKSKADKAGKSADEWLNEISSWKADQRRMTRGDS